MLALRRARLVSLTGSGSVGGLVDVLIADGRVRAIGTAADLAPYVGKAETVDLDGRYVLPGLWDSHVHFGQWAVSRQRLDLTGATSAAAVCALVAERAAGVDGPVVGYGFRDALWPDGPHRDALDAVAPGVPVFLAANDLHSGWYNSAALRLVGHADHPTGLLRESAFMAALLATPGLSPDRLDAAVHQAAKAAAARGIVGVVELEHDFNVAAWTRRVRAGTTFLRVECGVYKAHLDDAIERGWRTGDVQPDTGGLVEMGRLKVITDGSLNTRTAYCHQPYLDSAGKEIGRGDLVVPPKELVPLMRRAAAHGIDAAVHAIGDHANTLALDAYEQVGCGGSIEHAQLLTIDDFRRFADLDLVASVQPQHAVDDREVADRYWPGRTDRAFAYAALLSAGVRLALGSDAPVAPLDPWISVAAAVQRSDDDRPSWHPEQELPASAALAASTRGRRLVRVGEVADLVITEENPLEVAAPKLRSMSVFGTLLAGSWTTDA
ncbi:amidohydrolase family protein [Fodinicola feengrottensis]|uniref:Amidohydrolase family protein n=2 Tax=Fodinicola feengrottensis TaxID=435914 RepID=A0ABN2GEN4_9ACTN